MVSHYATQAGLKLSILLPQSPKYPKDLFFKKTPRNDR
jgi:hypothetical protein